MTNTIGSVIVIKPYVFGGMWSTGPIGVQRFLPWHRVYLFELEQMLQVFDPEIFIPYWDWSVDRSIPYWLQNFTPTVIVDGLPRTVTRAPEVHSNPRSRLPPTTGRYCCWE